MKRARKKPFIDPLTPCGVSALAIVLNHANGYRKFPKNMGDTVRFIQNRTPTMTKSEKLRKLGNAVRDYRGMCSSDYTVWKQRPKTSALARVTQWLVALKMDVPTSIAYIDNCQTWEQFRGWIGKL